VSKLTFSFFEEMNELARRMNLCSSDYCYNGSSEVVTYKGEIIHLCKWCYEIFKTEGLEDMVGETISFLEIE